MHDQQRRQDADRVDDLRWCETTGHHPGRVEPNGPHSGCLGGEDHRSATKSEIHPNDEQYQSGCIPHHPLRRRGRPKGAYRASHIGSRQPHRNDPVPRRRHPTGGWDGLRHPNFALHQHRFLHERCARKGLNWGDGRSA